MDIILSLRGLSKIYPNGTLANKDISIDFEQGSIHAIVGENGAGKSTLMKMIFGEESPTTGEIIYQGEKLVLNGSMDAIKKGIGMVHQQLMLAPGMTVKENLMLGLEPTICGMFVDRKRLNEIVQKASARFGFTVPLSAKIEDLSIGQKQSVEIQKVLIRDAELIVLDEPTAVLTPQETDVLFSSLLNLKSLGKTIIFISHKLKEVKRISDRITVIRAGRVIETFANDDQLNETVIAQKMVGRNVNYEKIALPEAVGKPVLSVSNLTYYNDEGNKRLNHLNFVVRSGEIVGIAGVEGNGQSELSEIITGLRQGSNGEITLFNENISSMTPRAIREHGMAHIPEDRMHNGMAGELSINENVIVDRYYKNAYCGKFGFLKGKSISKLGRALIQKYDVRAQSENLPIASLSGGNIQKVIVARELSSDPQIIVAAHPTRGVDIGSAEIIHNLLNEARDTQKAVLLISADLDEILKLSTRILVLFNGEIVAEFVNDASVDQNVLSPYMIGLNHQNEVG